MTRVTIGCWLMLAGLTSAAGEDWSSFRNAGTSVTRGDSPPIRWDVDSGMDWVAAIPGYGQSSPVVFDGAVYVTSSDGPWQKRLFVHAYDLATGERNWTAEVTATTKVENYFRNSRAAPTCVVDADRVVSFFASGDVTAMDHDGNVIWSRPLFQEFGSVENERGTASSPALNAGHVFVVVDHAGPSYLLAIRKSDGAISWKADRGVRVPSWSSPVVVKQKDREVVVVSSADTVDAYEAATGKLLWQIDGLAGNHIPSATVSGESVFTGSTKMFHQNSDEATIAGSNCRIDLVGDTHQMRWGAERANSYYSSPLVLGDYVYYVNKSGVLYCVDKETGKQHFAKRIGNPCWASAIGVTAGSGEQYAYFFTKNGFTVILRPGDQYDQVARNRLWDRDQMMRAAESAKAARKANAVSADEAPPKSGPEKVFAGMPEEALHQMFSYGDPIVYGAAFADDRLLIRTGQQLYCVRGSTER